MTTIVKQSCQPGIIAAVLLCVGCAAASAGDELSPRMRGFDPEKTDRPLNRFGLSYRAGFNIKAEFKNLGFQPTTVPDPSIAPANLPSINDRTYDDGFVRRDSAYFPPSGAAPNGDNFTANWHYTQASQVDAGNQQLLMHKASSSSLGSSGRVDGDPQHGLELTYNRELGTAGRCSWGLEAAFNYMDLQIQDNSPVPTGGTLLTDKYDVSNLYAFGGAGPTFPGQGSFTRAPNGQIIPVTPLARTGASVTPFTGTLVGQRNFDANVFGFRLGPYLEYPISQKWHFSLSGGLAVALIYSDFSYSESITLPGAGTLFNSGSGRHNGLRLGGYAGGNISYAFSPAWSLFGGAQYQYLGRYQQTVNGKEVDLDLTKSIFVSLGVGFSF